MELSRRFLLGVHLLLMLLFTDNVVINAGPVYKSLVRRKIET